MVELRTRKTGIRGDEGTHHEELGIKGISSAGQLQCLIWQLRGQIQCIITHIRGLPIPITQEIPRMSHIRSYPPHHGCHHPPSLCFSSRTQPLLQNTKLSRPSLSPHAMSMNWYWVQHTPSTAYTKYSIHQVQHTPRTAYTKYSIHHVQHTPSTAYTEYSIHRVKHTPSTAYTKCGIHPRLSVFPSFSPLQVDSWMYIQLPMCLPTWSTSISQLSMRAHRYSHFVTFSQLRVDYMINGVSAPGVPSIDRLQVLVQSPWIMASKCIS